MPRKKVSRALPKKYKWSDKYPKCKTCGTTKKKHTSRGLCTVCYSKEQWKKRSALGEKSKEEALAKSGRPLEWTPERIEKEAKDLVAWSEDEVKKPLIIEEFGLYRNPPYLRETMYKLGEINPIFRLALMVAKERLRSRREGGALRGTYNASTMQFTHGFHDKPDNDKDQTFTEYKQAQKTFEKRAEGEGFAQALTSAKGFVDAARERMDKEGDGNKLPKSTQKKKEKR